MSTGSYLIPETYIEDKKESSKEESLARLEENTQQSVELTTTWRESVDAIPPDLQVSNQYSCFPWLDRNGGLQERL